jgi:hypothetical protein
MPAALITGCNSGLGKDAELIAPLPKTLSDAEFEDVMRKTPDCWD